MIDPVTLYLGDQMVIVPNDAVLAVNNQRARDASGHAAVAAYLQAHAGGGFEVVIGR